MGHEVAIDTVEVRSTVALRLTGELTGRTAATIVAAVERAVAALPEMSVLVLDLRELRLLTVSGIGPLTAAAEWCAAQQVRCRVVVTPGSAVATVLDAAGVQAVLPIFPDVEHATVDTVVDVGSVVSRPVDDGGLADLSGQFEVLTRILLNTTTVGATLQHVIDATVEVIPAAAAVSVTLRSTDGEVFTPVRTHSVAADLDQVQYRTGQGPCLDAADPTGPAYAGSRDLATERRWPEFSAAATAAGYQAVHSTEVLPGVGLDRMNGALNIYFLGTHSLSETDRNTALLLATHAALALANAHNTELAGLHDLELHRAIDSRDVIGQAKGILMYRQGITADAAFELLRATSQDLNVKLVDIARNLVARHSELDG